MTTNPAVFADLTARWPSLTEADETMAQAMLDDAWAVLQTLAPALSGLLDNGGISPDVVRSVICAAVLRVLRNPTGNKSESIDDYSYTRDTAVSSGSLYFSDDELDLVRGVRPRGESVRFANSTIQSPGWYW